VNFSQPPVYDKLVDAMKANKRFKGKMLYAREFSELFLRNFRFLDFNHLK
jgi:hypothetical protein